MGLFSFFKNLKIKSTNVAYERAWTVKIDNNSIISIDYKQVSTSILIDEITKVIVETNDSGPWGTDVWWIISDGTKVIRVPGGATGEQSLLIELQKLEGFDNNQLIKSMSSTDNVQFVCYSKNT